MVWRCFAVLALVLGMAPAFAAQAGRIRVVDGTQADGRATVLWKEILQRRLPPADFAAGADTVRPYTPAERAWARLIRERARGWHSQEAALVALFAPVEPPAVVSVVLGNRGAEDAFSHKPAAIGFDLAALQRVYGDASGPDAGARLDRFFRHEYIHLLQHAWWRDHPHAMETPLERAIADIWAEGLGNYFSLSARWRAPDGGLSRVARDTLQRLEPRLAARLSALACSSPERAEVLAADLSSGPFDRKWGALPAALWLAADTQRDNRALHDFAQAGPDGVWALAQRHLSPELGRALAEAREAGERCAIPLNGEAPPGLLR